MMGGSGKEAKWKEEKVSGPIETAHKDETVAEVVEKR
jgi:hypothetical protein